MILLLHFVQCSATLFWDSWPLLPYHFSKPSAAPAQGECKESGWVISCLKLLSWGVFTIMCRALPSAMAILQISAHYAWMERTWQIMIMYVPFNIHTTSNILTVLEMLASSPGSPVFSKYVQNASRVLILPIKILDHHCRWKYRLHDSHYPLVSVHKLFSNPGLVYSVYLSIKEWATNLPLAAYPCGVTCSPPPLPSSDYT